MSTNIKKDSPDNWITKLSRSKLNKPYYYNKKTKKSQWNQPDILKTGNNELNLNTKNLLNKDNFSQKNADELLSLNLKSGNCGAFHKVNANQHTYQILFTFRYL